MRRVAELTRSLDGVVTLAERDLNVVWGRWGAEATRDVLVEVLPPLIEVYSESAAVVAADWYDDLLAGRSGGFRATPARVGESGAEALARWGVGPLFQKEPDLARARSLIAGGMQRRIFDAARDTVMGSSIADPRARGWRRIARPDACPFCVMLAARGAVYSESTVAFASHDDCKCQAVPNFKGPAAFQVPDYTKSTRRVKDSDRARLRRYLAEHHAG